MCGNLIRMFPVAFDSNPSGILRFRKCTHLTPNSFILINEHRICSCAALVAKAATCGSTFRMHSSERVLARHASPTTRRSTKFNVYARNAILLTGRHRSPHERSDPQRDVHSGHCSRISQRSFIYPVRRNRAGVENDHLEVDMGDEAS